jgi:hypothetical protein
MVEQVGGRGPGRGMRLGRVGWVWGLGLGCWLGVCWGWGWGCVLCTFKLFAIRSIHFPLLNILLILNSCKLINQDNLISAISLT